MFTTPIRKATAVALGSALAVTALGAGGVVALSSSSSVATAAAMHHVYRTGGSGLYVHTGPSTSSAHVALIGEGAPFAVNCWTGGTDISGDSVWLQGSSGSVTGWVTDYYIDTHWRTVADFAAQGIPTCGSAAGAPARTSAPTPAQATPSSIPGAAAAIAWADGHIGQNYLAGWCLQFVWDAYYYGAHRNVGGAVGAYQWWAARPSAQHRGDTSPPAGAFVFWGPNRYSSYGHVALSLGGGQVISTEEGTTVVVHTFSIAARDARGYSYLGWIQP